MEQIAILVDAGYLMSACYTLVTGHPRGARRNMILDPDELLILLTSMAKRLEPDAKLLRMYWYDGALAPDKLTEEQQRIGVKDYCKLRLGTVNSAGTQKGVDTLIVLDLLALSERRAVASMLLVAGDEDVLAAVEIAQQRGVKVHLVGIDDPKHPNQAPRLVRESDTSSVITGDDIPKFFALLDGEGHLSRNRIKGADDNIGDVIIATVRNVGYDGRIYFTYSDGAKKAMLWPDQLPAALRADLSAHFAEGVSIPMTITSFNREGAIVVPATP